MAEKLMKKCFPEFSNFDMRKNRKIFCVGWQILGLKLACKSRREIKR